MAQKDVLSYYFYQEKNGLYPVPQVAVDEAVRHAREEAPRESVGVVCAGQYFRLTNVHEKPEDHFEVAPAEWQKLVAKYGDIQAIIHSHPRGLAGASKHDIQQQMAWDIPFGIVSLTDHHVTDVVFWGGGTPIAPYKGRPFKDGIYDCYALGRDWYRQEKGIILPDWPRSPTWWEDENEPNIIEDNFKAVGFEEIEFTQLKEGDAVVGSIFSGDRINHVGIYIGDGLILHHLYGDASNPRISGTEIIYSWRRMIRKCLRYKGLQAPAR